MMIKTEKNKTEQLIERYFEATATAEEEKMLRKILADPSTERSEAVEEARAVMGFTTLLSNKTPRKRRAASIRVIVSAAASLALIATVSIYLISRPDKAYGSAAIYCQSSVNHSTEDALEKMRSQLSSVGQGISEGKAADILEAFNVISEDYE